MEKLFGAIDEVNEGEYLAIVIGLKSNIDNNISKLPDNFSHMTRSCVNKKDKLRILQSLELKSNVHVCCVKFGIPQLQSNIEQIVAKEKSRKPKHIIYNQVAHELGKSLHDMFDKFVNTHSHTLEEIRFQVDNRPIENLLHTANLKYTQPDDAHKIADCVAHANGKHWPVSDVVHFGDEFKRKFHNRVISRITR
jgi:hypothetical protein